MGAVAGLRSNGDLRLFHQECRPESLLVDHKDQWACLTSLTWTETDGAIDGLGGGNGDVNALTAVTPAVTVEPEPRLFKHNFQWACNEASLMRHQ